MYYSHLYYEVFMYRTTVDIVYTKFLLYAEIDVHIHSIKTLV